MFISNSVKLLFWKRETHDHKPVSCFHCLLFKTLVIGTDLECSQHLFFIDIRWFWEVAPGTRSWESLFIYASRNDNSLVNTITIRRGTPKTELKKKNQQQQNGRKDINGYKIKFHIKNTWLSGKKETNTYLQDRGSCEQNFWEKIALMNFSV